MGHFILYLNENNFEMMSDLAITQYVRTSDGYVNDSSSWHILSPDRGCLVDTLYSITSTWQRLIGSHCGFARGRLVVSCITSGAPEWPDVRTNSHMRPPTHVMKFPVA